MYSSLFSKLINKKSAEKTFSIAIMADRIVLAYAKNGRFVTDFSEITYGKIEQSQTLFQESLTALVQKHGLAGFHVDIVLARHLHQNYQIDKPDLEQGDKYAALPFLIKDFIGGSPASVTADGYASPVANRYQVFAAEKATVQALDSLCQKCECLLRSVTVEDSLHCRWTTQDSTEMLLFLCPKAGLQISVISHGALCFHRQIRGVFLVPNSDISEQLADELALELQRSLDYLRGQLRQTAVSRVVVDCDGLDNTHLADLLSQRLNVDVLASRLFTGYQYQEKLALANIDGIAQPLCINLFHPGMRPKPELLSAPKMLVVWALSVAVIMVIAGVQHWHSRSLEQDITERQALLTEKQSLSQQLTEKIKNHLPSRQLEADVEIAKQKLETLQHTLAAVHQHDAALQQGYAAVFDELATIARGDISVDGIYVSRNSLDLEGQTASPDAVPAWVAEFRQLPTLASHSFEQMRLSRSDSPYLHFSLFSERRGDKEGNQ